MWVIDVNIHLGDFWKQLKRKRVYTCISNKSITLPFDIETVQSTHLMIKFNLDDYFKGDNLSSESLTFRHDVTRSISSYYPLHTKCLFLQVPFNEQEIKFYFWYHQHSQYPHKKTLNIRSTENFLHLVCTFSLFLLLKQH